MQDKLATVKKWLGQGSINLFGIPFAGKETQGGELAELLGGTLLGGGTILRGSVIPPAVKATMDRGELVPTDEYIRIVLPYLNQPRFNNQPLVLSSVGRWHGEEAGVLDVTAASGHPLKAVIFITVSDDVARERHKRAAANGDRGKRLDDAVGLFKTRLAEFHKKTMPVIEFYRDQGLLITVNGNQKPSAVTKIIIDKLADFAAAQTEF